MLILALRPAYRGTHVMFTSHQLLPSPGVPLTRRTCLGMAAAAFVAGCTSLPGRFEGSFLQPWQSYESLSLEEWRRRLSSMRAVGCDEMVVQWSSTYGGEHPWAMPDTLIQMLFDECGRLGMGIRLGLPYDERWWKAMGASDAQVLPEFLASTQSLCIETLDTSPWPVQAGFRGWYLPYELDQYNWATPERRALLIPWLQTIANASAKRVAAPLAVSTFYSRLPTPGTLAKLWEEILNRVLLRPMLQDGVGVAGMGNYAGLEPLRALLRERGVPFDLIVELFEQLTPLPGTGDAFRARAADRTRVRAQMEIARNYGADRVIAFALDPWLLGDTEESLTLARDWGVSR